jgi:hypothetical protein
MMDKSLVLQLQTAPAWTDQASQLERLTQIVDGYCVLEGAQWHIDDDAGHSEWINVQISVANPMKAWEQLCKELAADSELYFSLSARWIVVGQGSQGWSNYKTFAHYDPSVKLDTKRK